MNLVRQGPKKGILYQQVQKHHGLVYSLDFTSKSNDLKLFGPMEHWLKMLWACRKCSLLPCPIMPRISWLFLDPLFWKCCTTRIFQIHAADFLFGPYYYGYNIQVHLYLKNFLQLCWLRVALVGPLIPRFHNMALRRAVGDGTSKLPRGSMFSWVAAWTTLDVQPFLPPFELGES